MTIWFSFLPLLSILLHPETNEFPISINTYILTIQKKHHHDGDVEATYFIVRNKKNKQNKISSHKIIESKGQITIVGSYRITKKFIEFKEIYFNSSKDSMMKRFYPNKYGNLILTEYTLYKGGVAKKTKL